MLGGALRRDDVDIEGAAAPEQPIDEAAAALDALLQHLDPDAQVGDRIERGQRAAWGALVRQLVAAFPDQCSLLMAPRYDGQDSARHARLARLAAAHGLPTVASAQPLMHHGGRRRLADVLTAIAAAGAAGSDSITELRNT